MTYLIDVARRVLRRAQDVASTTSWALYVGKKPAAVDSNVRPIDNKFRAAAVSERAPYIPPDIGLFRTPVRRSSSTAPRPAKQDPAVRQRVRRRLNSDPTNLDEVVSESISSVIRTHFAWGQNPTARRP